MATRYTLEFRRDAVRMAQKAAISGVSVVRFMLMAQMLETS
ncbi:hypothetical protein [Pacificibacter marinus]|nr:hypothetical protein [Pacificibacter marinus]